MSRILFRPVREHLFSARGDHPSGRTIAGAPQAAYLFLFADEQPLKHHRTAGLLQAWVRSLDLAPGGVYLATAVTYGAGALLPHLFTLTSHPPRRAVERAGGLFLWHYPAGRPGLPLATTVLCGVRTFLRTWPVPV